MLQIAQLTHTYQSRREPALAAVSFTIAPGEIYGLLGPNGAGKTTLINILAGLLKPDRGTVQFGDRDLAHYPRQFLGIAPQQNLLYPELTVWENLRFFAQLYGVPRGEQRQRLGACLALVGLHEHAADLVQHLSGGFQRRLNLALALVSDPKILIVDEPTTGLDIEARSQLWESLRQLKAQGLTLLLTTHLLDEAEQICDRIGILQQGQLLAQGTLTELRQTIAAAALVWLDTPDLDGAIAHCQQLGYTYRLEAEQLLVWLPQTLTLPEIMAQFPGIPLEGIVRQPIRLAHIYREVTRKTNTAAH